MEGHEKKIALGGQVPERYLASLFLGTHPFYVQDLGNPDGIADIADYPVFGKNNKKATRQTSHGKNYSMGEKK